MKKVFFLTLISLVLASTFFIPASALSMQDITTDPNYEEYVVTETVTMDIILDPNHDYYYNDLYYDDLSVLKYEFQITNYEGLINIWCIELYDGMGENSWSYYSGDEIVVPRTSCGVRMELYSDVAYEDVVIEFRTYRYRLTAEFSSASTAFREGYDKGRADEAEMSKGYISDAYTQGGIDRSNEIADHLNQKLQYDYDIDVAEIRPGFNRWISFSSEFLAAMANQYESVEIPNAFQSGYDRGYKEGGDGAVLEGEPPGSYQLGYDRGYIIGKTEAFDSDAIVESIDKLAGSASVTLLQILNTKILDYTLMEFLVALVMLIVVIVGTKIIGSLI